MLLDKLVTVSGFVEGRLVGFDNSQEVLFTEESSVLDSLETLLLTSSGMFLDALTSLKTMNIPTPPPYLGNIPKKTVF